MGYVVSFAYVDMLFRNGADGVIGWGLGSLWCSGMVRFIGLVPVIYGVRVGSLRGEFPFALCRLTGSRGWVAVSPGCYLKVYRSALDGSGLVCVVDSLFGLAYGALATL